MMNDDGRPLRRRLLILACSAAKRTDPGRLPARQRYDGPLWRTLRAADPASDKASAAFLSARFGFRAVSTPIEHYDARLTADLARRMVAGDMTTRWPRPSSPRRPDTVGMHPGAEIASLMQYGNAPFDEVALVGGALYLQVMRAWLGGFMRMGCVQPRAQIVEINGSIGRMRQALRIWLDAPAERPAETPDRSSRNV